MEFTTLEVGKLKLSKVLLMVLMGIIMIAATACGNNNGGGLEGEVEIDGSSTVFPIMEAVAEEYGSEQPRVRVTVNVSGTGGGFKRFTIGETDFSNASRPIKKQEISAAEQGGIEYKELILAYDGLSVVVSKDNDFVTDLTVDELKSMFLAEGGITTWKDVRPEWPDEKINFFSPGTDSGTFDYWNEVILEDKEMRRDVQLSEDDNSLVTGIAGDKYAIGFFGYNYYIENKNKLNVVAIDGGKGPIAPTNETVETGEYAPLSRPLYSYVNVDAVKNEEVVYDFLLFTLNNAGFLAEDVGYVRLPQEKYDEQIKAIEALRQ
jgi:phosphate transport system substrate-binding protein